ncbi:ThuA domain-containing protein [Fibrella aquatica]|uniref:ThuA domain-containing protein n=1 Tax=Fibrella aquatica TaxID=3242487 RepID=UPI003520083B
MPNGLQSGKAMLFTKKAGLLTLLLLIIDLSLVNAQSERVNWKRVKVLVYTKNGKGYVHDNIPFAVQCMLRLGKQHGFSVDTSSRPDAFSEANLKQYNALIFASTNNDVFDADTQRLAFRRYIEAGGGFVGIHSVLGTERNWPWFKRMMGGTFLWHPRFQPYRLRVLDANHPSMKDVPTVWTKSDECYFMKELSPGPTTVLAHELGSLNSEESEKIKASAGAYTELYPAAWYYHFDGGYTWCTALGHDKKDYADPTFVNHLFQGLRYVVSQVKSIDHRKAYAQSASEVIR